MPLYEYICRHCSHPFEELVFGHTEVRCPRCNEADVERQLSTVSVGRGREAEPAPAACGRCGDPRGPGACSMN